MGPEGTPAAKEGDRLQPLFWHMEDGSSAWSGTWEDTEREERCTVTALDGDSGPRCLPAHRNQTELRTFAGPTCDGPRALEVYQPGYILEMSTGRFFKLGPLLPGEDAWILDVDGVCVPVGPGKWYRWDEVELTSFVGASLE